MPRKKQSPNGIHIEPLSSPEAGQSSVASSRRVLKESEGQRQRLGELLQPRFFNALSDPSRIAILERLAECGSPRTAKQIEAWFPVHYSVVCHHLKALRDAGILESRKHGREVFYCVLRQEIAEKLRGIADAIASESDR